MANNCIMCGRIIEDSEWKNREDEELGITQKAPSFCPKCQAKIRNEADGATKPSKPI